MTSWSSTVTDDYEEPQPDFEAMYNMVAGDTEEDTEED